MNGGTNIALSIKQAGQLLKGEDADAARIIVLLTDGRVDAFQGQHLHPTELSGYCIASSMPLMVLVLGWAAALLGGCMAGRVRS